MKKSQNWDFENFNSRKNVNPWILSKFSSKIVRKHFQHKEIRKKFFDVMKAIFDY